ncbi:RNA-directed DNA polymerase, eukaryota, reverse transcriptase zinc-binding domain protein [Tanacetum coccineum]
MLSSGGRLTLIKSVLGSLDIYYFSIFKVPESVLKTFESLRASFFWGATGDFRKLAWIKWSNILASLDKGGLGVGSLKAFNNSLLLKWRWRLLNKPSALWVEVLKSIHGNEAGIELKGCQTNGIWARIVGTIYHLHSSGYVPLNSLRYQVGDGSMIRFWNDTWLGDAPLCSRFNRLFRLEKNQNCLVRDRIVNGLWAWDWRRPVNGGRAFADLNNLLMDIGSLNVEVDRDCVVSSLSTDGSYLVSFIRKHIDNCMIANSLPSTRWCKIIPRKVNIFMWRLLLDRLPHRINLSSRGLDIDSILCPNPTVTKSVGIDIPNVLESPHGSTNIGFGFCPNTSDIKLVRINCIDGDDESTVDWEAKVFTLSTRVWKSVSNIPLAFKTYCLTYDHVSIGGFIYWKSYDSVALGYHRMSNLIVSFDLKNDEFGKVCLPDSLEGVTKSFSKMFSMKMRPDPLNPSYTGIVGFRKNGEAVMETEIDGCSSVLEVYEPSVFLFDGGVNNKVFDGNGGS